MPHFVYFWRRSQKICACGTNLNIKTTKEMQVPEGAWCRCDVWRCLGRDVFTFIAACCVARCFFWSCSVKQWTPLSCGTGAQVDLWGFQQLGLILALEVLEVPGDEWVWTHCCFNSRWFPLFFIHGRCCCAPAYRSCPCFSILMRHYGGPHQCLQSQINETGLEPSGVLSTQPCLDDFSPLCTTTFKVMDFKLI